MKKLEEIAQTEEKKLELAEQYLEEDAALFDEFLKENDRNASEAIKVYGYLLSLNVPRLCLIYSLCCIVLLLWNESVLRYGTSSHL